MEKKPNKSKFKKVKVDLSLEEFVELAKIAHEKNITFNQLCNDILREKMSKIKG